VCTLHITDKNADRAEEAAERFKEVQNAYEVLSDKHERAWWVQLAVGVSCTAVTWTDS
jgi:DnaJ-class molecular chaperone